MHLKLNSYPEIITLNFSYELLTTDQPFVVDSEGIIRNTEILEFEKSHNHILSVVAYDCGMKRSQPVMVTIKVNRVCHLGWKGIPKEVNYAPGSGRQELFPSSSLELCSVPCGVEKIQSRISLITNHIGKGCDRDTYSVPAQRKMCGKFSIIKKQYMGNRNYLMIFSIKIADHLKVSDPRVF